MTDAQLETALPSSDQAPRMARRCIDQWFGTELGTEELDKAKLLSSELVTNAVVHGDGQIVLRADLDEDRLLVEVIDEGGGFEREVSHRDPDEVQGMGLAIVEAESSRWGIHEGTTHVWFELERPGPRLGGDSKPAD